MVKLRVRGSVMRACVTRAARSVSICAAEPPRKARSTCCGYAVIVGISASGRLTGGAEATLEEDRLATAQVGADSPSRCRQRLASEECVPACV